MRPFWEPAVRPLLEAASPEVVVEIGARNGDTTRELLELAAERDWVVHSIDPSPGPGLDPDALRERYGERFVFHEALSLAALPGIGRVDAALVDGDHNWYTVFNELRLLAEQAERAAAPFPLTFLHDVDWPYGRRDLYYDPETIPAEHRHPYRQAGIVPGRAELSERGGINAALCNAEQEQTPRNGVRTGIEDFLEECALELRFESVSGFNGLGIVADEGQLDRNGALAEVLAGLRSAAWLQGQCERLERARNGSMAQFVTQMRKQRSTSREREAALRAQCERLERELEAVRAAAGGSAASGRSAGDR